MQTTTLKAAQREPGEHARARAIVRFNTLMFHGLTTASFLETAVPLHVNRLDAVLAALPDARLWLEQVWWPQRAEHGQRLRAYVEATWPEFDWNAAYEDFHHNYRPRVLTGRRPGVAPQVLGLCTAAAQAAVFYRALANCADEPSLRVLMREAASDHAAYFDYFRALFERCKQRERLNLTDSWRTVKEACRSARDSDVAAAFEPLACNWNGNSTVPILDYAEFVQRTAQLVQRHAALGPVERLLFRPWLKRERAAPVPELRAVREPARGLWVAPQVG